ncbi:MAG: FtsW/RodA/SpoVE family cell cycle protein [Planctomycetota bacterium]
MKAQIGKRWEASAARRRRLLRHVRWGQYPFGILLLATALLAVGLVLVHTMSEVDALFQRDDVRFDGHIKKVLVSSPFVALGLFVTPRLLRKYAWLVYGGAIALLALVPIIGEERNNARRWIPTPVHFDVQPSEFAKIALIVVLARVLHTRRLDRLRDWVAVGVLTLVPMGMVMAQPDLGTALTLVPVALGMTYLAGGSGRAIAALVVAGGLVGTVGWQSGLVQDYQMRRVETWARTFEPEALIADKDGQSFHVYHARVCIGGGGMDGLGLGGGLASRAGYLPERESDSIFCVVAEEGGFVGATVFVTAYVVLVLLLLRTAAQVRERFTRFVIGGIAIYFGAHFFINAGVNLGLVPMTGLTLPLLSTGGSSMLATATALGLALGLAAQQEPTLDEDAFRD